MCRAILKTQIPKAKVRFIFSSVQSNEKLEDQINGKNSSSENYGKIKV